MPITSMLNSKCVLSMPAAFVLSGICVAANAQQLTVRLPDARSLSIAAEAGKVHASTAPRAPATGSQTVSLGGPLARELARSSEVIAVGNEAILQNGRTFLVLGVAIPFIGKSGGGYCGAGTEDFLLLVELNARASRLELRDRLQVQSCVQSMELQSDRGNDLHTALRSAKDPANFTLTWLRHPRYGPSTKTVSPVAGKFAVGP